MVGPAIPLVTGQPTVVAAQCFLRGTGTEPSVFSASDTLTASVIPSRQTTVVFNPAADWYTRNHTQTGYDQAQVQATMTSAQMALLEPSIKYTIVWWRTTTALPGSPEMIARMPLLIEPIAIP